MLVAGRGIAYSKHKCKYIERANVFVQHLALFACMWTQVALESLPGDKKCARDNDTSTCQTLKIPNAPCSCHPVCSEHSNADYKFSRATFDPKLSFALIVVGHGHHEILTWLLAAMQARSGFAAICLIDFLTI